MNVPPITSSTQAPAIAGAAPLLIQRLYTEVITAEMPSRTPGKSYKVTLIPEIGYKHCPCPDRTGECHHITELLERLVEAHHA